LNREVVDSLADRHQGSRKLRQRVGGVDRTWESMRSMQLWVVDDMTSNLQVVLRREGGTSLIQQQIVATMDSASRKIVGWSISDDKAPTAELVCEAVLNGFKKYGVPRKLGLENGFVFGKSLLVNGKVDSQGRTIVAGLNSYGCSIRRFGKMNPRAKGELEKTFDLLQRSMERHPGYGGRHQMFDAPEIFKKEERLIIAGKVEATKYRWTFEEGVKVINQIIETYNSTPQYGHLKGLSPNDAFEALRDESDPPIQFPPELCWLLANARYRVTVKAGGVTIRPGLRVRGGRLADQELLGRELWALVERGDRPLVTFMNLDFTEPFTMAACEAVSPDEARGVGVLASERSKICEHTRSINDKYNSLADRYGDPRQALLNAARQPDRQVVVDPQLEESGRRMEKQREQLRVEQNERKEQRKQASRLTRKTGIVVPSQGLDDIDPAGSKFLVDWLSEKEDDK
jgi:hypothetical protein